MMKTFRFFSAAGLCLLVFCSLPIFAQTVGPFAITSNQCAPIGVSLFSSVVGIQVTGTWSGTLQPQAAIQGQAAFNVQVTPSTSTTAQATITANGAYFTLVAGYSNLLICGNTVTSGTANVWLNLSQAPAGSGAAGGTGSNAFSALTSSTNVGAAMAVGSNSSGDASLTPSGSGQVTNTTSWLSPGGAGLFAPQPVLTGALTGGTLTTGTIEYVQITINNALGSSLPSLEKVFNLNSGNNCASGSACSVTVTAPTLTAGQTYTVYSANGAAGTEKQQTALAACVAITTNCVIGTSGTGAVPPSTNTTIPVNPPNLQASECPTGVNPFAFQQDTAGNFHTGAGLDTTTTFNNVGYKGFIEFCRPVIFNSSGVAPDFGANGALVVFHRVVSPFTVPMQVQIENNPNGTDSTTYSNPWLGLYSETDLYGTAVLNQIEPPSSLRGTFADRRTGPAGNGGAGAIAGVSGFGERTNVATTTFSSGVHYTGVIGTSANSSSTATGGNCTAANQSVCFAGVLGDAGVNGGSTDSAAAGLYALAPTGAITRFANANYGFFSEDFGSNTADYNFYSKSGAVGSGQNYFGGPIVAPQGFTGSVSAANQFGTIGAPTLVSITCTGSCTNTWSYVAVAVDRNGREAPHSGTFTTAVGAPTLNGTNFNTMGCCASFPNQKEIYSINIYRTVSGGTPATLGLIGNIPFPFNTAFVDNGLAGNGATAPTVDQTGSVGAFTYSTNTNCAVNSASPAACGSAAAGAVVIPTTTATYTVNTTAVTSHSRIGLTWLTFASDLPSTPTCVAPLTTTMPTISAVSPGVSFTIALTSTTGQTCPQYTIED
jgi:hypothetical protein